MRTLRIAMAQINPTVGDLRGNMLEVHSGLQPGDQVVSAGVPFLRDQMKVELWEPDQGLRDG